jgi:hypothetical protein
MGMLTPKCECKAGRGGFGKAEGNREEMREGICKLGILKSEGIC